MSNQLLLRLEEKINHALEIIEVQRMQLEEAEQINQRLQLENSDLQNRQIQWEESLSALLKKLSNAEMPNISNHSIYGTKKDAARHRSEQLSQTIVRSDDSDNWNQEDLNEAIA